MVNLESQEIQAVLVGSCGGLAGGLGHLWSRPTPVRRPRRPAAASAAVEPAQSPELSCAVYLELAHRPTIRGKCALGWVCRPSLWVWWSSLVGGSIFLLGLCLLGSSVRAGALGFVGSRNRILCVCELLRVWWSICGCVCACLSSRLLCRVHPLLSRSVLSLVV